MIIITIITITGIIIIIIILVQCLLWNNNNNNNNMIVLLLICQPDVYGSMYGIGLSIPNSIHKPTKQALDPQKVLSCLGLLPTMEVASMLLEGITEY